MPVSALVLTLAADRQRQAAAFDALRADPRLLIGPLQDRVRLPVVTETSTLREGADLMREILGMPGVVHVDVVRVDFDDVRDFDEPSLVGKRHRRRREIDAGPDLLALEGLEDGGTLR